MSGLHQPESATINTSGGLQGIGTLFLLGCLLLCACATPFSVDPDIPLAVDQPEGVAPDTFKILTYNAWHGLDYSSLPIKLIETPEERAARKRLQIEQIAAAESNVEVQQKTANIANARKRAGVGNSILDAPQANSLLNST